MNRTNSKYADTRDRASILPLGVAFVLAASAVLAVLGGVACDDATEDAAQPTPPEQATGGEAAPEAELTEVEMVALMEGHYNAAIASHDALIRGDVAGVRTHLAEIRGRSLPAAAPESWRVHERRLHDAAEAAAEAADLESAGPAMAAVAEACGACHAAVGLGDIYREPRVPVGDDALEDAMLGHQWATERLWEGLTGPWDDAWMRGANALAASRVFGGDGGEPPAAGLLAHEAAMREAGEQAKTTEGLRARSAAYGRLLTTCAQCHQEANVSFADVEAE